MQTSRFNPAKPIALTAVCIIGLVNAIQMLNALLAPMVKQLGAFYPWYFGAAGLLSIGCVMGLWFLQRWAAWAYGVVLLVNQAVLLSIGLWEPTSMVVPVVIIGVMLRYSALYGTGKANP